MKAKFTKVGRIVALGLLCYGIWVVASGIYMYVSAHPLDKIKQCIKTKMHAIDLCDQNSSYVKLSQIPKDVWMTFVLSEDASFFSHDGLDREELKESLKKNWEAKSYKRGGSTITQQLVKNVFLNQRKTLRRKAVELVLAKEIEDILSKKEILEKYLNVIEFGEKIYGIGPAAKHYFGRKVSNLNSLQAAFLAMILPNPQKLGSVNPSKGLSKKQKSKIATLLARQYSVGLISNAEYHFYRGEISHYPRWENWVVQEPVESSPSDIHSETYHADGTVDGLKQREEVLTLHSDDEEFDDDSNGEAE